MKFSLYQFAWDRWYKRAKKHAMKDPVYAAQENGRRKGSFYVGSGTGTDGKEYTLEEMWDHMEHFHRLCPTPWWVKVHHFRDNHRLRFWMKRKDIRDFIQRGKRGYSDSDLWSFDSYLSGVIAKATKQLSETVHGAPCDLEFEDWQKILLDISEGFSQDKFGTIESYDEEKFNQSMELFVKYFHHLWD